MLVRTHRIYFCFVKRINPAVAGNGTTPTVENTEEMICEIPPTHVPSFNCFVQ